MGDDEMEKPLNGLRNRKDAAPEFISGIIERAWGKERKVINFNPSTDRREIVNFLYIKKFVGMEEIQLFCCDGF